MMLSILYRFFLKRILCGKVVNLSSKFESIIKSIWRPQKAFFFTLILLCLFKITSAANHDSLIVKNKQPDYWVHIRNIVFDGNKITKPYIITRELNIREGDSILNSELEYVVEKNKTRILNSQLFASAKYDIICVTNDTIDIYYKLTELFYWWAQPIFALADRNINVWWYEQNHKLNRTNIGLEFTRINFRGRTEKIGFTAQVGYNKYFDIFYNIPYLDKNLKQGAGIKFVYETGREIFSNTDSNKLQFFSSESYPYQRFQTMLSYSYRKNYTTIHELNISYNTMRISQQLYDINPAYLGGKQNLRFLEMNYLFKYNNTDNRMYPTQGIENKTIFTRRGLGIDRDVNQWILNNEFAYYHTLWRSTSMSFILRARLLLPQTQPYYYQRAMGFKSDYVRGYEYYVVDGNHFLLCRLNVRHKIADFTFRQNVIKILRFIPVKLFAKVYDDVGYTVGPNSANSFLNNRWLNGYGAGLDLVISYYLKFRIEYSFNHLKENGLFLHGSRE